MNKPQLLQEHQTGLLWAEESAVVLTLCTGSTSYSDIHMLRLFRTKCRYNTSIKEK